MALLAPSELRNAARGLLRAPTVTISAVLCLALGIGATTAIASAISRALLHQLPFRDPGALVAMHRVTPQSGPLGTWPMSAPNYIDLARMSRQIESPAAIGFGTALVALGDETVQASQLYVTGNMFPMLGARAERGRLLVESDAASGAPVVAVLSAEFWRSRLGADPAVVGRDMMIDGTPTTIVGIAPTDMRLPHGGNLLRADIWMPLQFRPQNLAARRANYLFVMGRLARGATPQSAEKELTANFASIVSSFPELRGEDVRVAPLQEENTATVRKPLLLLGGAVSLVLLIACTNVAALLLARGVQRRREMAVRTALGATPWDAMRLALTESVLVAGTGALLGLALAAVGVRSIGALAAARMPQLAGLSIDGRIIAFAVVLTVLVALACGIVPAVRGATVDPQDALRGGRSVDRGHHRALRALVAAEIATSVVLLIGAGLVLKAFAGLMQSDPGFDPERILTLRVMASPAQYQDGSTARAFLEPALAAIEAAPGVEAAGAISATPYVVWGNNSNIRYEGVPPDEPTKLPLAEQRRVTPGFFAVTGQKLRAGRLLSESDDENAPYVVVVNQALVNRDFRGLDPVGRRFHLSDTTFGTIVGVVSDIRNVGPYEPPAPEMYATYRQASPGSSTIPLMVRVRNGDPGAVMPYVRAAIRRVDASAAIADVKPMPEAIQASLGRPRFYLSLLGVFAAVALALSIAGLYGVLSYAVAQRTREFGIRLALGSPQATLMRLVTGQGLRLVVVGLVIGLAVAAAVTRVMQFMLFGVSPLDVTTWALAALLMLGTGLIAALLPARRAMRVDPVRAIQAE